MEVSRALTLTTDLDLLLKRIAEAATQLLACERASIFLHDASTAELWTKVALLSGEIRVPASAGIVGCCFSENRVVLVPDAYADERFNPEPDSKSGFRTRNILSAPMLSLDRKPLGVIQTINKHGGEFEAADLGLVQLLADQAGVAIQRYRLQAEATAAAEMRKEMSLARKVQQAMLPKSVPEVEGVDVMGWTRPASMTGGDCYDFWKMKDGRLGIFLADASGHGIGPTIIVSQVRTLVRALCDGECDPGRLLALANARVAQDIEGDRFVTAFVGMLSRDGELKYASAGHGPLLCREGEGKGLSELESTHPPIGIMAELEGDRAEPVQLKEGGALVVVSDGIFEAPHSSGEQFGMERVLTILNGACAKPARETIELLKNAVTRWQGKEEPADDQTVVICRRTGMTQG